MTKTKLLPQNLVIVNETAHDAVIGRLSQLGAERGHFTNGNYSRPAQQIMARHLAGTQYMLDGAQPHDDLYILVNSDKSLADLAGKLDDKTKLEDQRTRALKVAVPTALQYPDHRVIVIFYDEETPKELFASLRSSGLFSRMTLHKHGYGYGNRAIIEGGDQVDQVVAFTMPDDQFPYAHDVTRGGPHDGNYVVNLGEAIGRHGTPYLSADGRKVLFPLVRELAEYSTCPPLADRAEKDPGGMNPRPF